MLDRDAGELDDARLVDRIAAGDEAAFVIAYDRHAGFVFGSVVRFLGDRETASEIVQDAFVALWRRARQYDSRSGSLLTWLLAIARHRAIDRLRAEGRRPARDAIRLDSLTSEGGSSSVSRPDVPPELIADAETDPGTATARRWTQSVVRSGISQLPEHEREVIVLGYALDLSQTQIAERLEWPLGTVKSRTRRALAQLRGSLVGLGEADEGARQESDPATSVSMRPER
ncbi:MAG TPA: sigma-70 family RNA polymerase sigma factor [Candidatus Limnocylindria bacterium]|nr:sigma-70 family RNA polymerase sigma factor [Candidatus Limnocylindria bacterium]